MDLLGIRRAVSASEVATGGLETGGLPLNTIIHGHAIQVLTTFPDQSIDMVITSPPYFGLRDYQTSPQIWDEDPECMHEWQGSSCILCGAWRGELGSEPSPVRYVKHLCDVFDQVHRVLKDSATCWVNLGDSYASAGGPKSRWAPDGNLSKMHMGRGRTREIPSKSLCQIPSRFALEMTSRGWILRNEIIWWKPTCLPASVQDRFTVDFEKLFFFTKNQRYYFAQQFEPSLDPDRLQHRLINPDNLRKREYGDRLIGSLNPKTAEASRQRILALGRNKRCVWKITPRGFGEAHFAVYPPELIETPIKAGCPLQGVVLDPFVGSGTTALTAFKLNRQFIGIELNATYIALAERRIARLLR